MMIENKALCLENQPENMNNKRPSIGDCYVLECDNHFYAVILVSIVKTVKNMEYSFVLIGKKFNENPGDNTILDAGILGRRVPNGCEYEDIANGSYIEKGQYTKGYDYTILGEEFSIDSFINESIFVSNYSISAKYFPQMGSLGVSGSIDEICKSIQRRIDKIDQFEAPSSFIKQEVFNLDDIVETMKREFKNNNLCLD